MDMNNIWKETFASILQFIRLTSYLLEQQNDFLMQKLFL